MLLTSAAAGALALIGAVSPASAATWTLLDFQQRICVEPHTGSYTTYFVTPVHGTWSTTIRTGLSDLPPGSTSGDGAVNPGDWDESDNEYIGMVPVTIAPAPLGEYVSELWATDGTETQTVPVRLSYLEDCYQ